MSLNMLVPSVIHVIDCTDGHMTSYYTIFTKPYMQITQKDMSVIYLIFKPNIVVRI